MSNILITGTSKGIGNFLVRELKDDFNVFGISRTKSNIELIEEFNIDLTRFELFDEICKNFEQNQIKLDGIILNAGIGFFGEFENGDEEMYKQIINLNLLSPILLVKKLLPFLNKKAKIIFIGSIASKKFMKYSAVYQSSKFGLRGFAGTLKNELKQKSIHIINPKIVETSFHDNSKIKIDFSQDKITSFESIISCVRDIFSGKEKRFEIDL